MAPRTSITVPTTLALSNSSRIPSTDPFVRKTLGKLSRASLLSLVGEWLDSPISASCIPALAGDDADDEDDDGGGSGDGDFTPARSLDELKELYAEIQRAKVGKRGLLDRVLHGDWRNGISLRQLAMADVLYFLDHPTSQKWTALKLERIAIEAMGDTSDNIERASTSYDRVPRFHAPTFLRNLQDEVGAIARAHYHLTDLPSLSITLLRIQVHGSPYHPHGSLSMTQAVGAIDVRANTILYVAFPSDAPFLYVSSPIVSGQLKTGDSKTLRKVLIDALPKAFSRPRERYTLKPTSLSAKSLATLASMRGSRRGSAASAGWKIFADGSVEDSPLVAAHPTLEKREHHTEDKENLPYVIGPDRVKTQVVDTSAVHVPAGEPALKRRKMTAEGRFGHSSSTGSDGGMERIDIRLKDSFTVEAVRKISEGATTEHRYTKASNEMLNNRGRHPLSSLAAAADNLDDDLDEHNHENHSEGWIPDIHLTFSGSHVFAGIRQLVEAGAICGYKMPGWLSGEHGVSIGVVRNQKINSIDDSRYW